MRRLLLLSLCLGCRRSSPPAAQPAPDPTRIVAALNRYYADERACLWITAVRIPHDYPAALGPALGLFRVPAEAGLLKQTQTSNTLRVELTPLGLASWLPASTSAGSGNLCYATLQIALLSMLNPAVDPVYGPVVQVSFLVNPIDQAPWSNSPEVLSTYGQIRRVLPGSVPGVATMRFLNGTWQVAAATSCADTAPSAALGK